MRKFITFTILIAILIIPIADAQQFIVRTVYFQPTDVANPTPSEIIDLLVETQDFYRSEMQRHGYGPKTFTLETTPDGYVGFHHKKGKYTADHYLRDTYNRVTSELPFHFTRTSDALDNILVIIVGGISQLSTGDRAFGGYYPGDHIGGVAIFSGEVLTFKILAHEIGHTFGLNHTNDPNSDAIMWNGSKHVLDYEARWLDRHPFFNETHNRNQTPQIVEVLPISAIGDDVLRFKIISESNNELYQVQLTRLLAPNRLDILIGVAEIEGHSTTIKVDVDRRDLRDGDGVGIQIMDIHGNRTRQTIDAITLPLPIVVDINADGVVNIQDLVLVASRLGDMWEGAEDVNRDGVVNILDLVLVANAF